MELLLPSHSLPSWVLSFSKKEFIQYVSTKKIKVPTGTWVSLCNQTRYQVVTNGPSDNEARTDRTQQPQVLNSSYCQDLIYIFML